MFEKKYTLILILCILLFHIGISAHGFYSMFSDYEGWTLYHFRPFLQLLFTMAWLGIASKKRWAFFIYITLICYELIVKFFMGNYLFGEVFGDVFFPIDALFAFIIMLVYRPHFSRTE